MAIPIKVPSVGESVKEVTLSNWPKSSGDWVEMDDVICEIESDKATVEINAETSGVLKILVEAGETVPIGHIIGEIDPEGNKGQDQDKDKDKEKKSKAEKGEKESKEGKGKDKDQEAKGAKEAEDEKKNQSQSYTEFVASPAAKKILDEKGVETSQVSGTGKGGRITKADALKTEKNAEREKSPEKGKVISISSPSPDLAFSGNRSTQREKMSALRRTIAKRLVEVKNTTAMLTTFNEVDMSEVMKVRSKYKEAFKEKHDVNLGFMSFFTKAVTFALQEFPAINGMIDGDDIVYNHYCDVGIAVSTPRGLVVPIVRNAEMLSLANIEKEILRLALKARDNKLSMEEMTGGTFTITNGGVFGSMLSTPIINAPQSAILGMHNIVERPVAINGEVKIRPIMYVALSYDHRIVDGRESVSFLKRVKEYLEDPTRLLLGV